MKNKKLTLKYLNDRINLATDNSKKWRKSWAIGWNMRERDLVIMKWWLTILTVSFLISLF